MEGFRFDYDPKHDVVWTGFDNVTLSTPADVDDWAEKNVKLFTALGRRVDIIIDLSGLHVRPAAARQFGQRRKEILERFVGISVRYAADVSTAMFINTSSVLYGVASNMATTPEEALELLARAREERRTRGSTQSNKPPS